MQIAGLIQGADALFWVDEVTPCASLPSAERDSQYWKPSGRLA